MSAPFPHSDTQPRCWAWIREHRVLLLWILLLLLVLPMRDLWSPDEPDFAQCVREMRERGSWLLPYLNGRPYDEKPILFYWMMKCCAMAGEWLTGGRGFDHGTAAWALRLPSVLASIAFMAGLHRWTMRFLDRERGETSQLILAATVVWFWQSQFIQIDMVFGALLAWSWLAWLGGYLLLRGHAKARHAKEPHLWFLCAYGCLGLAFLAKGPLGLVLSAALLAAFLAWQRDWKTLGEMRLGWGLLLILVLVAPWYVAAGMQGGPAYAYQMIVHQNLERALRAWDHIQPFYQYAFYLFSDFFPWVLLLPALALFLGRRKERRRPATRFFILAFAVPFVLLSLSKSKQGKYLLMCYPFLALLLADYFHGLREGRPARRIGALLAGALGFPALALLAVAFFHGGGLKLQASAAPYLGPLRLTAMALSAGAVCLAIHAVRGRALPMARITAATLCLVFLVLGTWGFRALDPAKNYRQWTAQVQPLIAGRNVYYWQTIRSGVMVYTDHRMPELWNWDELEAKLGPEDRLVTMRREWIQDGQGLNPQRRAGFEVLLRVPVGSGEAMLLKRRPKS